MKCVYEENGKCLRAGDYSPDEEEFDFCLPENCTAYESEDFDESEGLEDFKDYEEYEE